MRPDKGKRRAQPPTEHDPLLGPSTSRVNTSSPDSHLTTTPSRLRTILLITLIVTFSFALSAVLLLALLAASFRPSPAELSSLPQTAFRYTPPDSVSVLNVTDAGIWLNVTIRCGVDTDRALGVQGFATPEERTAAEQRGDRGLGAVWWERLRRWTARKSLALLPSQTVQVTIPDQVYIFPQHFSSPPLVSVAIATPIDVPLVKNGPMTDPSGVPQWLLPTSFTTLVRPIATTGELWDFAQHAWAKGTAHIVLGASTAVAELPGAWWSRYARVLKQDLVLAIDLPVPRLPGLPHPGHPLDLSSLVTLRDYTLKTTPNALTISARAAVPNIIPDVNASIPFGLPFSISIPGADSEQFLAEVVTKPVSLNPHVDINVEMTGQIVADLQSTAAPLSGFLQNYLHGLDNPILVRGLAKLPLFAPSYTPPPQWLLASLPSLSLPLSFPGPQPPPQVIKSVSIEHMRISESGGKMLASGVVIAEVELPEDLAGIDIDVSAVQPDVLVFDGPAPDDDGGEDFPPRAFGHIHPNETLPATTEKANDPLHPHRLVVRAPLTDVPLDILPGRDGVLSGFVSKVIFKGGAEAGIKGSASVRASLSGVNGNLRLNDLPVTGLCWVGRQR